MDRPSPAAMISEVRRKVGRARRELTALRAGLQAYDSDPPYRVETRVSPYDGTVLGVFRCDDLSMDPEWQESVGAIAYQCQSSLDRLITALVVANGGTAASHRGQFLISMTRAHYAASRNTAMRGVDEAARCLVDQWQPFRNSGDSGAHPLAVLVGLSRFDKHRDGAPSIVQVNYPSAGYWADGHWHDMISAPLPPGHHWAGRGSLHDGDELRTAFPAQALAELGQQLRAEGVLPSWAEVQVLWRLGVRFNERVSFADLEAIIDFVEHRVVPALAPLC